MNRIVSISSCVAIVLLGLATAAVSQNSTSRPQRASASSANSSNSAAEREKIWNSPTMLRARAWVQEYCQRSAKITPAEAQQYMKELENLTPVQMKLWLLKFDHEEAMNRQQQADFELARRASLRQAISVDKATQQDYSAINRDENEAAATAEQSIQTQAQEASAREQAKQDQTAVDASNMDSFYGGYGGYGLYPGYGLGGYGAAPHIHIHVHSQTDSNQ